MQPLRSLMSLQVVTYPCESSGEAISVKVSVTVVDDVEKRTGTIAQDWCNSDDAGWTKPKLGCRSPVNPARE